MFVITEKVKQEHSEICPIRQEYLRSIIDAENTTEQINRVTKDIRESIVDSFANMTTPNVDIGSDSVIDGNTSTAKMFNVVFRNAKVSIGSNVTIVNAAFSDCVVHIPSNSVVYGCSFHRCRVTLNVLEGVLLQSSSFSEQDIIVCSQYMVWLDSSIAAHSYRIICDTLLFGNNKSTSKSDTACHKIDAVGKTVILFNTLFNNASDIQVTQPKRVKIYRQASYYSSNAMVINKLHLLEDSVTQARATSISVYNKGALYINGQSESTVKYTVGKNSKVSTEYLNLHWYYRNVFSEINVADNVVADIINLRRSTETLYIKEGFEGVVTNYTGTNRGGTVIVRKVHGDRARCSRGG